MTSSPRSSARSTPCTSAPMVAVSGSTAITRRTLREHRGPGPGRRPARRGEVVADPAVGSEGDERTGRSSRRPGPRSPCGRRAPARRRRPARPGEGPRHPPQSPASKLGVGTGRRAAGRSGARAGRLRCRARVRDDVVTRREDLVDQRGGIPGPQVLLAHGGGQQEGGSGRRPRGRLRWAAGRAARARRAKSPWWGRSGRSAGGRSLSRGSPLSSAATAGRSGAGSTASQVPPATRSRPPTRSPTAPASGGPGRPRPAPRTRPGSPRTRRGHRADGSERSSTVHTPPGP